MPTRCRSPRFGVPHGISQPELGGGGSLQGSWRAQHSPFLTSECSEWIVSRRSSLRTRPRSSPSGRRSELPLSVKRVWCPGLSWISLSRATTGFCTGRTRPVWYPESASFWSTRSRCSYSDCNGMSCHDPASRLRRRGRDALSHDAPTGAAVVARLLGQGVRIELDGLARGLYTDQSL